MFFVIAPIVRQALARGASRARRRAREPGQDRARLGAARPGARLRDRQAVGRGSRRAARGPAPRGNGGARARAAGCRPAGRRGASATQAVQLRPHAFRRRPLLRGLRKPSVNALEARGVTKEYGALRALDAVDLALAPGELAHLSGENGAGKSTLLRVLGARTRPTRGSVRGRRAAIRSRAPTPRCARGSASSARARRSMAS